MLKVGPGDGKEATGEGRGPTGEGEGGQEGVKLEREKQKLRCEETTALRVGVRTMRLPSSTQREKGELGGSAPLTPPASLIFSI